MKTYLLKILKLLLCDWKAGKKQKEYKIVETEEDIEFILTNRDVHKSKDEMLERYGIQSEASEDLIGIIR